LFGGTGFGASGSSGYLNDLWSFDGTSWKWVSGSSSVNPVGTYGTKGTGATTNTPGGRERAVSWIDSSDTLWLIGGFGYPASGTTTGYLNDLWKFTPSTLKWTYVSGATTIN